MSSRPLKQGIYVPLPTFFKDDEELDLDAYYKHVQYTAARGILPVSCGSMGEAVHLDHEERAALIRTARRALDDAGLQQVPILAGAGQASTRETIKLAKEAAAAGADHVIVVPGGYYAGALKSDSSTLKQFYVDVAAASPIPVMLYNFPAVAGGIDMDSDLIEEIAVAAPNTCGVKLTCGAVGKLTRITALTTDPSFATTHPRTDPSAPFITLCGFIDFLLPAVSSGAGGAITGVPNFAPRVCAKLWELCLSDPLAAETKRLQNLVARADWAASNANIPGMKRLLNELFGYGYLPRRPLAPISDAKAEAFLGNQYIQAILDLERKMEVEAGGQ
ncbi:putative dihydrodipicolinate synthase [Peniophora sp. CONT]|nr:putative dihydrodipicolinate synthase [Peniophora sp. CONT]